MYANLALLPVGFVIAWIEVAALACEFVCGLLLEFPELPCVSGLVLEFPEFLKSFFPAIFSESKKQNMSDLFEELTTLSSILYRFHKIVKL
jgi:hypothetical protein